MISLTHVFFSLKVLAKPILRDFERNCEKFSYDCGMLSKITDKFTDNKSLKNNKKPNLSLLKACEH